MVRVVRRRGRLESNQLYAQVRYQTSASIATPSHPVPPLPPIVRKYRVSNDALLCHNLHRRIRPGDYMSLVASIPQGMAQIDATQNRFSVLGQIATAGSYVVNGDTLDLSTLDTYGGGPATLAPPLSVRIWEQQSGGNSGWQYNFIPGTTLTNGKVQLFGSNGGAPAGLAQPGAVTYASLAVPATLYFEAVFPSFVDNQ